MDDINLLQYIHQSAEMGKVEAENALYNTAEPDFRKALHRQRRNYQEIYSTAANYLIARGIPPKSVSAIRRIGSAMNFAHYQNASGLANSMARKQSIALHKSAQRIGSYKGNDLLILSLANDLKKAEEFGVKEMQNFIIKD